MPETEPIVGNSRIHVRAWIDPVVEQCGFGPRSEYVEYCYLPVLGPSSTWLYRRLGQLVVVDPAGVDIDLGEVFRSLGLAGLGRSSPAMRTLARLVHFGVARWAEPDLLVRRALAPLPARHLDRLPSSARRAHLHLTGQVRCRAQ